jgi:hypothetical protein
MESQAPQTAKRLGEIIGRRLLQYKAKQKWQNSQVRLVTNTKPIERTF